ncbi:MAG: Mov34/MPN/PAD-1 family protein, partial [Chloroflexota bacterium]
AETAAEMEEAPAQATAATEDTEATAAEEAPAAEAPAAEAPAVEAPPAPPPGRVRIAGLRRPVGHPTRAAADILVNEPAFRDAQAHALSSPNREVAGMLIGPRPEKQPDGRYVVHVTDVIIAKHTRMHGASVTYTPESWRYVSDRLNERYPDEEAVIVGWYHTHPGFGIFLSGMDLFIHQNFFTQKWHVALVLDPLAQKSGFFCWDRQQSGVHPYDFPWPEWAPHSW